MFLCTDRRNHISNLPSQHFIKQAKHFANGDNPEQVNKEIEKFIIETVHKERKNYAVL